MENRLGKLLAGTALLLACLSLAACGQTRGNTTRETLPETTLATNSRDTLATSTESTASETAQSALKLTDYFPLTPDVFLKYDGTGNEYVPMTARVEFVHDDKIQISYDNGGTEIHRLFQVGGGQVRIVASLADLYVREDLSVRPADPDGEILIQEPLAVGTNWTVNGRKRSISAVDAVVTTPAGTFSTLEVTTEGESNTTRQYYAPGIGLVKMTISGDIEIAQELHSREAPKYHTLPMTFYYGRLTDLDVEILYREINIEFRTNDDLKAVLTRYFRQPIDPDLPPLISAKTTINSVQLDPENRIVTIDFSPELVTEMNAGSSFEAAIIRSIVNTVGHAYGVEKVMITLDQHPYESGHIALGPGEYFGVDYQDMVPLP